MQVESIFEANRLSLQRIQESCGALSEAELLRFLPNGWTIAVTLAHLAFWDQKVIYALERTLTEKQVWAVAFDESLNDILAPILAELPPDKTLGMALHTGARLDAMLESCPPELLQEFFDANPRWVNRSLHREGHLADIQSFFIP